ncbi:MAG: type IV pilus assembly protein PilM [Candidatus Jorgensenbacteria bacterium]
MGLKSITSNFFTDIKNFLSFGRVLGVDIGTASVKMVELARKGDVISLENYGVLQMREHLVRANAALQSSSLKLDEQEAIRLLKILLSEVRPKAGKVIASVPSFSSFAVPIEMPLLTREETEKSMVFQARQYIPMPAGEMTIEWEKVGEFENQQGQRMQRVLVSAIPNALIAKYQAIFRAAGLQLVSLESEGAALARALFSPNDRSTLLVDIGTESTAIVVVNGLTVQQIAQTDYGGISLTQALARGLGISVTRAEELKWRRGLLGGGAEAELSTSLLPFLDVIIQECERVRVLYERMFRARVERLMLAGGGANLRGIGEYFSERLGLPLAEPRPFTHVTYPSELEPTMQFLNRELPVAAGLALRFYR